MQWKTIYTTSFWQHCSSRFTYGSRQSYITGICFLVKFLRTILDGLNGVRFQAEPTVLYTATVMNRPQHDVTNQLHHSAEPALRIYTKFDIWNIRKAVIRNWFWSLLAQHTVNIHVRPINNFFLVEPLLPTPTAGKDGYHCTAPHTCQSVGLLWTRDRPVAQTSTLQHTPLTGDRHPCPRRDSKPQSQQTASRRPLT
jgi:hypothetical protein